MGGSARVDMEVVLLSVEELEPDCIEKLEELRPTFVPGRRADTAPMATMATMAWTAARCKDSNDMKEIEAESMTVPSDEDSVDVYYLMSPLMLEQVGDAYAPMGSFHSGAAFIHKSTDVQVSVQFCANSFGVPLVLPSA